MGGKHARKECSTDGEEFKNRVMHRVRRVFGEKDRNGDGVLTLEEWGSRLRLFGAIDRDNDGKITPREIADFLHGTVKKHKENSSR